jgi:hypothetical protein
MQTGEFSKSKSKNNQDSADERSTFYIHYSLLFGTIWWRHRLRWWGSQVLLPAFLTSPFPIPPDTPTPDPRAKIRTSNLTRRRHSAQVFDVFLPSFGVLALCLVDVHSLVGLGEEGFYFALGFGAGGFGRFGEKREGGE